MRILAACEISCQCYGFSVSPFLGKPRNTAHQRQHFLFARQTGQRNEACEEYGDHKPGDKSSACSRGASHGGQRRRSRLDLERVLHGAERSRIPGQLQVRINRVIAGMIGLGQFATLDRRFVGAPLIDAESSQAPTRVKICDGICNAWGASGAMPA